ncbi:MAG: hypothetical protein HY814_14950 [Candidatus Riflebacteria bacterium]|nr:hypothetical protein [Candidatus Riflebacteria bacterium]
MNSQRKELAVPTPQHQRYLDFVSSRIFSHRDDPALAEEVKARGQAILVLFSLDLGPARPILDRCYAKNKRGSDPWDPVILLRALLLSILIGQPSLNRFVPQLRGSRLLPLLAGIRGSRRPGVGTLYDFLHRLRDGPVRRSCEHRERPSELGRRRSEAPRPKQQRPERKKKRKGRRKKGDQDQVPEDSSATAASVAKLEAAKDLANPEDLMTRLGELLLEVGVRESAERGLLGDDVSEILLCGDGSALVTGASRQGRKVCSCDKKTKCDCDRVYSDPDARFGWDDYRKTFFFGHHFCEFLVSSQGQDLPLVIRLGPGNTTDFTISPEAYDFLLKELRHRDWGLSIATVIRDKGHDGLRNYRYPLSQGTVPVIPLAKDAPALHPRRPDLSLSPRGVPLCEGGAELAPPGSAGPDRRLFVCPVKAGWLERCPKAPAEDPDWVCRPGQLLGPVVNLSVSANPRLCPPIPRNSERHKELMKLRSGCERSNSVKKGPFKPEQARHQRWSFRAIRLHLMALLQHAKAWVAGEEAQELVNHLLGVEELKQAA